MVIEQGTAYAVLTFKSSAYGLIVDRCATLTLSKGSAGPHYIAKSLSSMEAVYDIRPPRPREGK